MRASFQPSIRKQFLTKIYQRNSISQREIEPSEERSESSFNPSTSFTSELSEIQIHSPEKTHPPEQLHKRSSTPSIVALNQGFSIKSKGPSKRPKTPSKSIESMDIFSDFLQDLLHSNGNISQNILNKVKNVTKSLNDHFAKNPEFSLQFYISMSGILNLLNEPQNIIFSDLQAKIEEAISLTNQGSTELEQLTVLKKHISKLSLKVITVKINIDS